MKGTNKTRSKSVNIISDITMSECIEDSRKFKTLRKKYLLQLFWCLAKKTRKQDSGKISGYFLRRASVGKTDRKCDAISFLSFGQSIAFWQNVEIALGQKVTFFSSKETPRKASRRFSLAGGVLLVVPLYLTGNLG